MEWKRHNLSWCTLYDLAISDVSPAFGLEIKQYASGDCELWRLMKTPRHGVHWVHQEGADDLDSCKRLAEEIIESGEIELDALDRLNDGR